MRQLSKTSRLACYSHLVCPSSAKDVDDLLSVDDLEKYVTTSAAVLIMLGSRRYFSSVNCLREVKAARLRSKPLVLVHESDPEKNGAPLHDLKAVCPVDIRSYLFDGRGVLPWHRMYPFQCVTMIGIAEATLMQLPAYTGYAKLSLKLPGDVRDQALEFRRQVVLYTSRANPGAALAALELRLDGAVTCTDVAPEEFGTSADEIYTVFLLYLNRHSLSAGDTLSTEVRRALASRASFCLIHENDPAADGVPFSSIISSAGPDLVSAGLFAPLATPWHAGDYRAVSIKLALRSLGARIARPKTALTRWLQLHPRRQSTTEHDNQLLLTQFTSAHIDDEAGGGGEGAVIERLTPPQDTVRLSIGCKDEKANARRSGL